jgi:hypothetical protein
MTDEAPQKEPGFQRCKAKNRQGNRCKQPVEPGMEVCRFHGGKSLKGRAHPNFKHGRYSRHIPARMLATYEAAAKDPELLSMTSEIALLDARLADVLTRVDAGESGRLWKSLRSEYDAYLAEGRKGTEESLAKAREHGNNVDNLIRRGLADWSSWAEITSLVEARRKVVDSEAKRRVQMHQTLSLEQMLVLMESIYAVVAEHVDDPGTLAAIGHGIDHLRTSGRLIR